MANAFIFGTENLIYLVSLLKNTFTRVVVIEALSIFVFRRNRPCCFGHLRKLPKNPYSLLSPLVKLEVRMLQNALTIPVTKETIIPLLRGRRWCFTLSRPNRHEFLFIDFPVLSPRNFRPFTGQSIFPPQKPLDKRSCSRRLFSSRSSAPKRVLLVNRTTRPPSKSHVHSAIVKNTH